MNLTKTTNELGYCQYLDSDGNSVCDCCISSHVNCGQGTSCPSCQVEAELLNSETDEEQVAGYVDSSLSKEYDDSIIPDD